MRAEAAARGSLARRHAHNSRALSRACQRPPRATSLRRSTRRRARAGRREPEAPAAQALLGEVLLELGEYPAARAIFGTLRSRSNDPGVASRLARWDELEGRVEAADRLLRDARERALALHGLPREQRAWFHFRVGDLALRYGRLDQAEAALRAGLAESADDHRGAGGQRAAGRSAGRLAGRHRPREPGARERVRSRDTRSPGGRLPRAGRYRGRPRARAGHGRGADGPDRPVAPGVEPPSAGPRAARAGDPRPRRSRTPHPPRRVRVGRLRLGAPQGRTPTRRGRRDGQRPGPRHP